MKSLKTQLKEVKPTLKAAWARDALERERQDFWNISDCEAPPPFIVTAASKFGAMSLSMHDQLDGKLRATRCSCREFLCKECNSRFWIKTIWEDWFNKNDFYDANEDFAYTVFKYRVLASASLVDTSEHSAWFRHTLLLLFIAAMNLKPNTFIPDQTRGLDFRIRKIMP